MHSRSSAIFAAAAHAAVREADSRPQGNGRTGQRDLCCRDIVWRDTDCRDGKPPRQRALTHDRLDCRIRVQEAVLQMANNISALDPAIMGQCRNVSSVSTGHSCCRIHREILCQQALHFAFNRLNIDIGFTCYVPVILCLCFKSRQDEFNVWLCGRGMTWTPYSSPTRLAGQATRHPPLP